MVNVCVSVHLCTFSHIPSDDLGFPPCNLSPASVAVHCAMLWHTQIYLGTRRGAMGDIERNCSKTPCIGAYIFVCFRGGKRRPRLTIFGGFGGCPPDIWNLKNIIWINKLKNLSEFQVGTVFRQFFDPFSNFTFFVDKPRFEFSWAGEFWFLGSARQCIIFAILRWNESWQ